MPYNLPYSEYVDADPTVEDMNSVVNLKVSSEEKSYFYLKQLEMIPYLYKPAVPILYQYLFFSENSTFHASELEFEQICLRSFDTDERELATEPVG